MAKKHIIVDVVTKITPPVEKPTDKALEANPKGFVIEFGGGETARLLAGKLSAPILDILDDLREQKAPAYVEITARGKAINRLLIPGIMKVEEVRESAGGEIEVVLFPSHARHTLSRENEDFEALLEALTAGHDKDAWCPASAPLGQIEVIA